MRSRVTRDLRTLHAVAIENRGAGPGTPDVNYIEGWIELKHVPRMPRDEDVLLKIHNFTPQQRNWLRRRWDSGGNVHLLLQIGRHWLLFDGWTAATHVGRCSFKILRGLACAQWPTGLNGKELKRCLTR